MFSLLLPSSLPVSPQPVSQTHALFPLPSFSSALTLFNPAGPSQSEAGPGGAAEEEKMKAAVFLTGEQPLPNGAAASVHVYIPGAEEAWRVVGV